MYMSSWAKDMYEKYKLGIANTFILAGNIGDYVGDTTKLHDYLDLLLKEEFHFDTIINYAPNNGVTISYSNSNENLNGYNFKSMCNRMKRNDIRNAYIINYPDLFLPSTMNNNLNAEEKNNLIDVHSALTSVEYSNSGNMVLFICESLKDINKMLLSSNIKTEVENILLPNENERKIFLNKLLKKFSDEGVMLKSKIDFKEIVTLTSGLTLMNIEDIILKGLQYPNEDIGTFLTRTIILDRKKEIIRKEYGEIIEFYDTEGYNLERFAGQDNIKAYFKEVIIDAIKYNKIDIIPKGVLLMGPPGTGKTYFSRCLAGDAGINFVEFKMSKILDKWVGEAEKNLEKAFSVFRALAPVGVFIDELDQALSRGENDSNSVNKNLFGMFLAELSKPENRGKIIWLGATNYPNKIDEALKRSGRFDKKIPFFAPSAEERIAVFKIHLKKAGYVETEESNELYKFLSDKTEGYTQAEIENIVVKSLELATRKASVANNNVKITKEDLDNALNYMLSAQNSRIKEMEDIALMECNDLEFLSEKYRKRQKELINSEK